MLGDSFEYPFVVFDASEVGLSEVCASVMTTSLLGERRAPSASGVWTATAWEIAVGSLLPGRHRCASNAAAASLQNAA